MRRDGLKPGVVSIEGEQLGVVVSQDPAPGVHVTRNDVITIYVGAPAKLFPDDATASSTPDAGQSSPARPHPNRARRVPRPAGASERVGGPQVRRVGGDAERAGPLAVAAQPTPGRSSRTGPTRTDRASAPSAEPPLDGLAGQWGGDVYDEPSARRERVHESVPPAPGGLPAAERPSGARRERQDPPALSLPGVPRRTRWQRWRALPGLVRLAAVLVALCAVTAAAANVAASRRADQVAAATRAADPPVPASAVAPSLAPQTSRHVAPSARRRTRRRRATRARAQVPVGPAAAASATAATSSREPEPVGPHTAVPAAGQAPQGESPPPRSGGAASPTAVGGQVAGGPFSP